MAQRKNRQSDNDERERQWESLRRRILFWSGLVGTFGYIAYVQVSGSEFHVEFLLAFLAMTGVSLAQGLDKR